MRNYFNLLQPLIFLLCSQLNAQHVTIQTSPINKYLLQNSVTGISRDAKGYMWVSTQFGIYRYDGATVQSYIAGSGPIKGSNRFGGIRHLPGSSRLVTVTEDNQYSMQNGALQILQQQGFLLKSTDGQVLRLQKNNYRFLDNFKDDSYLTAYILPTGTDTLVNYFNNLYNLRTGFKIAHGDFLGKRQFTVVNNTVYSLNANGIQQVRLQAGKLMYDPILKLQGTKRVISNDQGQLWFQNDQTLHRLNPATRQTDYAIAVPNGEFEVVTAVYNDAAAAKIFVGTATSGMLEMSVFPGKVIHAPKNITKENYIYTYTPDGGQGYYSLTPSGLIWYDALGDNHRILFPGMLNLAVLTPDPQGKIWFSTVANKLLAYQPESRKIVHRLQWSEPVKQVKFLGPEKMLIVSDRLIALHNPTSGTTKELYKSKQGVTILAAAYHKDQLYIGTNKGLIINGDSRIALHRLSVRTLLPLSPEIMAIGTYGGGTFIWHNNQAYPLPTDPAGIGRAVTNLSLDQDSALWIIANKGAYIWSFQQWSHKDRPRDEPAVFLETSSDLPVSELNGGQTPGMFYGNQIVIPSSNGLVVFAKEKIIKKRNPLSLSVAQIQVDGHYYDKEKTDELSPNHNNIAIQISAPFYGSGNQFGVQYRLMGLDTIWRTLNNSRKIQTTRLAPGTYRLQIRLHPDTDSVNMLQIRVLQFWYLRPVFVLCTCLFILLLLALAYHHRIRVLQNRQNRLEHTIAEKTKSLRLTVRALATANKELVKQQRSKTRCTAFWRTT